MHLDCRHFSSVQRIEDGDRGMRQGAGVEQDTRSLAARFLNPGDKLALVVRLPEIDIEA